jgi:hypothetical protein
MPEHSPSIVVNLSAVIIALTDEQPRVLVVGVPHAAVRNGEAGRVLQALPTGPLDVAGDRTLELALRRWVRASAGLELGYVEQLYTFGDRYRDPRESAGGVRVLTAAYLALVKESQPPSDVAASWRSVYRCLPWEDWRKGRPRVIDDGIAPALNHWIESASGAVERRRRRVRAGVAFGLEESPWDGERVLDRYEILYELGLVREALRDGRTPVVADSLPSEAAGLEMAADHRRILATALGRIRAKIRYRPVVFELMGETFTLLQLQRAVEALAGVRLHKQNFRRLVEQGGLVERTGQRDHLTGGRPAELFRFRREVLLERPAPGVGLPGARR